MRTTVIRTTAAAVLLSAAALTIAGCSTSLQGPANPNDTTTTSYGPPVTTTVTQTTVSDTNVTGTNVPPPASSGGAPVSPTDTGTPSTTG